MQDNSFLAETTIQETNRVSNLAKKRKFSGDERLSRKYNLNNVIADNVYLFIFDLPFLSIRQS